MPYIEEIRIKPENYTFMRVGADAGVRLELQEHFSFFAPNYKWHPKFKSRIWDGKLRLFNPSRSLLHLGLFWELFKFCEERNYKIIFDTDEQYGSVKDIFAEDDVSKEDVEILDSIPSKYDPRDYQMNAILWGLKKKRGVIKSPTGSGKSLLLYFLSMWFLQKQKDQSVLVIVPTTSLVEQMEGDFKTYSKGLLPDSMIEKIYSGQNRNPEARITISTWQSLYNIDGRDAEQFYSRFGLVLHDEVHLGTAKCIAAVSERCFEAKYKFGFSGSLKDTTLSKLQLKGLYGETFSAITTNELQKRKQLADLKINCLVLKYPDSVKKSFINGKPDYQKEVSFILESDNRNKFIARLSLDQKKNTLVLFNYVEKHGKPLFKTLQDLNQEENRKIFFVSGSTDVDNRESIRQIVETEENAIICASSGTFSTGINIVNIHNIIFAFSTKSQIRVIQSIGRALRVGEGKTSATLFDIIDDISWKSRTNYGVKHATQRMEYYAEEKFKYKTTMIDFHP